MHPGIIFGAIAFILCAGIAAAFALFMNILVALATAAGAFILSTGLYLYFSKSSEKWLSLGATGLGGIILGAGIGAIIGNLIPGFGPIFCAAVGGLIGVLPIACLLLHEIIKNNHSGKFSAHFSYDDNPAPTSFIWEPDNSLVSENSISISISITDPHSNANHGIHFFPQPDKYASGKICSKDYKDSAINTLGF